MPAHYRWTVQLFALQITPNLAFNRTRRHAASVSGSAVAARRLT
jgi:hypothetical protein